MRSGNKIPVLRIISGLLIITSWFIYIRLIEPGYQDFSMLNITVDPVNNRHIFVFPPADPAITLWAAGYLALGIFVTGYGILQLIVYTKELEWLQVAAGLAVLTLLLLFLVELEPSKAIESAFELKKRYFPDAAMQYDTGWMMLRNIWKSLSFIPGITLITGGLYQYKKSRSHQ